MTLSFGILVLCCATFAGPQFSSTGVLIDFQSPASRAGSHESNELPSGTGIVGKLSTNLDTGHSKVGDRVEVEVGEDVKTGGRVRLGKGSTVTGMVTQLTTFSKGMQNAKLEIVFSRIASHRREQTPVHLIIGALAAKPTPLGVDNHGQGLGALMGGDGIVLKGSGPPNGFLKPETRGVFGFEGLSLVPLAREKPPTSALRSTSQEIHLEKGTGIVLIVAAR